MAILDFLFRSNKSKTSIGVLRLDILTSEEISFEGGATKYPVETGSEVSDHIKKGETTLRIAGEITAAEGVYIRGEKTRFLDALEALEDMHTARQEITIVTGLRQYENMAVVRLNAVRAGDGEGNWLKINAEFTRIEKVSSKTAEISEQKAEGETRGRAGPTRTRNTQNATSTAQSGRSTEQFGPRQSILQRNGGQILSAIGLGG